MRQKVTLASSSPTSTKWKQGSKDVDSKVTDKRTSVQFCQESRKGDATDPMHKTPLSQKMENDYSCLMDSIDKGYQSKSSNMQSVSFPVMLEKDNSDNEDGKDCDSGEKGYGTDRKIVHGCPRINENNKGAGALRYALHLRFLCPFPKGSKSVQRCKTDSASFEPKSDLAKDGERKFYLYNDLRVVFPQRHSDTDEGKVCSFLLYAS